MNSRKIIDEINSLGLEMIHQPLPSDSRQNFIELMGGK